MDESITERNKQAASSRNTSVSAVLAGLVRGLDALHHPRDPELVGPLTRAAAGVAGRGSSNSDAGFLGDVLRQPYGVPDEEVAR